MANDERRDGIAIQIEGKEKDLGGFTVRRVLPNVRLRSVGPFVFFDHMGPSDLPPGIGIQVRPHPHIGLATVTYLFSGEIMHRDSLGYTQPIQPGAVNLMTAGRGIVHSERAGSDLNEHAHLHGIQTWMALPSDKEQCDPAFEHVPAQQIPAIDIDGVGIRVVMGSAFGVTSPVKQHSPTLYVDCEMPAGSHLQIDAATEELAAYVVDGEIGMSSSRANTGTMTVLDAAKPSKISSEGGARLMIVGGQPVGRRHLWWNFVASNRELIEQAKVDWREQRFAKVDGDDEFIPLPN